MTTQKIRVALVFGGRSGEHEVSLLSAKSIYEALDKEKYDVLLVGVDKQGVWHLGESSKFLLNSENPKLIALNKQSPEVTAVVNAGRTDLVEKGTQLAAGTVDVFFPIIHGTYGEDGSLQGMFELLNTAYVGAGVLGSAVGMDKAIMKRLLVSVGIPVAGFVTLKKHLITPQVVDQAVEQLHWPIFVKPANLGSSVGVSKAHTREELEKALEIAFAYDTKILLEEFIDGREVECSVLGNGEPLASAVGEVIPRHEFYSYEAKYIDEHGAELKIPADLEPEIVKKVQDLAVQTFMTLECAGLARVDFFVTRDGRVLVNEINTLPGFTNISMYPKLWEISGIPYPELLDRLIQLAIEKQNEKNGLKREFAVA